jgi:hypothetical protein
MYTLSNGTVTFKTNETGYYFPEKMYPTPFTGLPETMPFPPPLTIMGVWFDRS